MIHTHHSGIVQLVKPLARVANGQTKREGRVFLLYVCLDCLSGYVYLGRYMPVRALIQLQLLVHT